MKIFYQQSAVQTVLYPDGDTTLLRARDTPLAEHCSRARSQSLVLGCDQQGSPMNVMSANASRTGRYTPYGLETTLPSATGFTGQLKAWSLPGYFLGSGYRFFNTVLMRFHSPDSFSPFAAGGINAYIYCGGDPVNRIDPSGHMYKPLNGSVKRPRSPSPSRSGSSSDKRSPRYEALSQRPLHQDNEQFYAPLSDSPGTSASTVSAGSSGHVVATISTGSSTSAGTTGSATFAPVNKRARTSTNNSWKTAAPTGLVLTDAVAERFQQRIKTSKPIHGLNHEETQRALIKAFDAMRYGFLINENIRRELGVDALQMDSASGRVRYWIKAETRHLGNNNFN